MHTTKTQLLAIIDDEKHIRDSLSQYFSDVGGFRTICFADGNEAVEWFGKNKCDICIVDIKMPGMSGIDAIIEIKKTHPHQKFIIFTGSRFQDIPEISEKLSIPEEYIIVKPLPAMEIFLDKVHKILKE